jgi:trimethylamine--corrinoid protein Co-methyltransferase
MRTLLQVLADDEQARVHEETLKILATTGVRVDTEWGRRILADAGAQVDGSTGIVRFPRALVEESLRVAPRDFMLGARRPGCDLRMNSGDCVMLVDGEALYVLDRATGKRRLSTFDDWLEATRLIDAIDEIGVYWHMVVGGKGDEDPTSLVTYWRHLFRNFSKHVQDSVSTREQATWLLEVLEVIFGDRESIRRQHPLSFLLCPQSPLIIEGPHTDAYLATLGWDIPVAAMPMPLMGGTAPGSLISTVVLGNCEVLALLCLVQAASPGTPFIYAPALAVMNPRNGQLSGGAAEEGLLGAAATEMGRYYGLPVEASGIGTDHHVPGIQASYERAITGLLPALAWPDILVGPGLLGGSMNLSFEQLVIDTELFRLFKRACQGIAAQEDRWLADVIGEVGPAGHFLAQRSTLNGIRGGEWYVAELGCHDSFEAWEAAGSLTLLDAARDKVEQILATHQSLPLDEAAERELDRIEKQARETVGASA